jgi:hypothetical protein
MMYAHSKSRWAEERRAMKEAIEWYHASRSEIHKLREENVA